MQKQFLTGVVLGMMAAGAVLAVPPETIYVTDNFDGIAPPGGSAPLPRENVNSNLVARGDQLWYRFHVDGALVASDTSVDLNKTPPPGVTGGAALKVGYIDATQKAVYLALTNEVWESSSDYTLTVVHRIAHRDGAVTNVTAQGTLRAQLCWVKLNNQLGFNGNEVITDIGTSNWSTSVLQVAGATLTGGKGLPVVIRLLHNTANTADHWTWVDSVRLEKVADYDVWEEGYGLYGTPESGYESDPDGDRVSNLSEYALGGNPTNALDSGLTATYGMVNVGGTNFFEFVYPRREDFFQQDLDYAVFVNDDLVQTQFDYVGWFQAGVGNAEDGDGFSPLFDAVTNWVPTVSNDVRSIRLNVNGP